MDVEVTWTLEDERQELINGIRYMDPGDDDYETRLKALKTVDGLIPEKKDPEPKIHWGKVVETGLPVVVGIALTAILEGFGLIFTSKSTFFWRKP